MIRFDRFEDAPAFDPGVRSFLSGKVSEDSAPFRRHDFLTSAFTPAGTNDRRDQEAMIRKVMGGASGAWLALLPTLLGQIQNNKGLYDQLSSFAPNLTNELTPGATDARIAGFGNAANENANKASLNYGMMARSNGWGDGGTMGKSRSFANDAARQTNQYAGWEHSPEGQSSHFGSVLQGLGGLRNWGSQDWSTLLSLGSLINGQQPVQVQPGLGDVFGQALGMYASSQGMGGRPSAGSAPNLNSNPGGAGYGQRYT